MTTRLVGESVLGGAPEAPHLVGSACRGCSTVTFPPQGSCPRCTGQDVERRPLPTEGTIWSWTIQAFAPKTPFLGADAPFRPFGVAYVDLGGVLVESRLVTDRLDELHIGMPVRLVLETFHTDPDGTQHQTFAFTPAGARSTKENLK